MVRGFFVEEDEEEFIVDRRLRCPHCRKKIGEKALREFEEKVEEEEKLEEEIEEKFSETVPVKKRVKHAKKIFRKRTQTRR